MISIYNRKVLFVRDVFVYSCQVGFSWFQVGFHGFSWFQVGCSWIQVSFYRSRLIFLGSGQFSWFFIVPGGSWWFFYGYRPVFKVPGRFFMVPGQFSWFFMVPSWFFMVFSWFFMFQFGFSWFFMVFHGSRLVFHGFSPKCIRPNCILAQRSSLGPPPGGRHRT